MISTVELIRSSWSVFFYRMFLSLKDRRWNRIKNVFSTPLDNFIVSLFFTNNKSITDRVNFILINLSMLFNECFWIILKIISSKVSHIYCWKNKMDLTLFLIKIFVLTNCWLLIIETEKPVLFRILTNPLGRWTLMFDYILLGTLLSVIA